MEISNNGSNVEIEGNIKSLKDFQDIKRLLDNISNPGDFLSIHIKNSISITSSVIGYFVKLINKDKVNISINVGDKRLFNLFDDLNLISLFHVKKV